MKLVIFRSGRCNFLNDLNISFLIILQLLINLCLTGRDFTVDVVFEGGFCSEMCKPLFLSNGRVWFPGHDEGVSAEWLVGKKWLFDVSWKELVDWVHSRRFFILFDKKII